MIVRSTDHREPLTMDTVSHPDTSEPLAAYIAATRFEDLPATVVTAVKHGILDTLGCVLAGTGCPVVVRIRDVAQAWAERGTCTVIGTGGMKAAPMTAVLVSGSAIHQYDFDDTHDLGPCHPSSTSVIPAIAVAESLGGASGRDLIRAVAHGNEVTSRASLAVHGTVHDYPWFRAPVMGLFGATAASAKIMGASATQHLHALGLTLPQVAGTWASLHHKGSSVRALRDGLGIGEAVVGHRGLRVCSGGDGVAAILARPS